MSGEEKKPALGILKGTITEGKLEGQTFTIYLGKTSSDAQIMVGGEPLLCTKFSLHCDVKKPVIEIEFTSWLLAKR